MGYFRSDVLKGHDYDFELLTDNTLFLIIRIIMLTAEKRLNDKILHHSPLQLEPLLTTLGIRDDKVFISLIILFKKSTKWLS